ncbi:MAG TPA: hypothetical protein PKD52_09335 [Clostridiales bacterium]|nr:hypothetical protein [Clostridiales bacterium]
MDQNAYETKKKHLLTQLKDYDHPVIACSAGADSALLTDLAFTVHPDTALAVFVVTEGCDEEEQRYAAAEAGRLGWRLDFIRVKTFAERNVFHNRRSRCYHCKKLICQEIRRYGEKYGGKHFMEGSNADDRAICRPGEKAVTETGFRSPLADSGLNKAEVRCFGGERGLRSAAKHSTPCLLTRFPYDLEEGFQAADIERIKIGEHHLKQILSDNFRLRFVDRETARIEASEREIPFLYDNYQSIINNIPFARVLLDETPFRSGSFDRKAGND